jgi:hypothetical protein
MTLRGPWLGETETDYFASSGFVLVRATPPPPPSPLRPAGTTMIG